MKTKEWHQMKDLTMTELNARLDETRQKLLTLSIQHRLAPVKNALQIRELRRNIARIKTLMRIKFNNKI